MREYLCAQLHAKSHTGHVQISHACTLTNGVCHDGNARDNAREEQQMPTHCGRRRRRVVLIWLRAVRTFAHSNRNTLRNASQTLAARYQFNIGSAVTEHSHTHSERAEHVDCYITQRVLHNMSGPDITSAHCVGGGGVSVF